MQDVTIRDYLDISSLIRFIFWSHCAAAVGNIAEFYASDRPTSQHQVVLES